MQATEQDDFPVKSLDLPIPITATIFGVKVLLNVPSQVFPYLRSNISADVSPVSIAALSQWLPTLYVPTTFMSVLNKSIMYLQNPEECSQYSVDSIIFLSNAFPYLETEFILNVLESFNSDLYNAGLYLNAEYTHAPPDKDSELIEILNPYASHQIGNFLAFDSQYQEIAQRQYNPITQIKPKDDDPPLKPDNSNDNNNNLNEAEIQHIQRQSQEDDDASFALAIQLQFEEEERQNMEMRRSHLIKVQKDDENYARALQARLEEEYEEEKKKREEEENLVECCCCYTSVPFIEMAQCPEGHLICRRCVQMGIETALAEGRVRTECPSTDGCNSKISNSELERILPPNLLQRLNETEALNAVSGADIPFLRTCWRCAYKAIDEDEDSPFDCPKCGEKTCKKCQKKFHQGRSCDEADLDPNRIVEKKMSEAIVKQCPKCKTQFIKDEGCNHMTCPRCKTEFCYLCGQVITGKVSQHYKSCKQFMDNNQYNNEQIQNARNDAIKNLGLNNNE